MDNALLERYFSGEPCTKEELLEVEAWLSRTGASDAFFYAQWKTAKGEMDKNEQEFIWNKIATRIPGTGISPKTKLSGRSPRRWIGPAVAAAVLGVILLSAGALFYHSQQKSNAVIAWKKIDNNDQDVKYIRMEDGTQVWLNAHSSLSYDEQYAHNGKRMVKLEGEAFFDVAQVPAQPFIVNARQIQTTVLGTSFDMRAWPSLSQVQVALVSGKVRIDGAGQNAITLAPGDLMVFDTVSDRLTVQPMAVRNDMAGWIKGKIVLDNTPLPEIFRQLEQIYHVTILNKADGTDTIRLSGQFRREPIENVLKNVLFPLDFDYSYEQGRYIIHKSKR